MSAFASDDPSTLRDIERVSGEDEALARAALERLWAATRPTVLRRLRRLGVRPEDAEDQAQRAAAYLWRHRRSFRARSAAEWHALARTVARRCVAAEMRSLDRRRRAEADFAVPEADRPYLDAFVAAADDLRRVYEAADALWLGGSAGGDAALAAAAVQQVLLERVPERDAATMFGVAPEAVAAWLEDPAIVARALFASLCWPGDALAGFVLRPERPLAPDELDRLSEERSPEAWPGVEARVVVWRARNAMGDEEIAARARGSLDAASVAEVLDRYRGALPFKTLALALSDELARRGSDEIRKTGLWRRIVFEYASRHELPHLHIEERAGEAARVAGVKVDMGTLNNWLSMRRLYAQLAARLREEAP